MPLFVKRIYEPSSPDDGHRLLVMRLWPRGIRKSHVDAWDRGLAPSRELLTDFRSGVIDWDGYVLRFREEMATRSDSIEALEALRDLASRQTVTVLCGCKDEKRCHRSLLVEMAGV